MPISRRGLLGAPLVALLPACGPTPMSTSVALDVPHLRQETLLCVPTAAAIVLAFYGDPQPPRKLKVLASGKDYRPDEPFNDYTITSFAALIAGLAKLGYHWEEVTFPQTERGFEQGIRLIEAEVANGRPPLVDISSAGIGHTLVVSGFDRQRLMFVDPDAPAPGASSATYAQFEAVWNENAYGGAFRAIIRTARRS